MRDHTTMELRVAEAIANSIGGVADVWLVSAKAAIRAMREPSVEMDAMRCGASDSDINPIWLKKQYHDAYKTMVTLASPDE